MRGITAAQGSLRRNETIGLAIVSAEDSSDYLLHREEANILSPHACTRKTIEFVSGRAAAHLALKEIGFAETFPVLRGVKGEPLWPEGITGSITHCFPWSLAVAVRCPTPVAIGVDLETTKDIAATDISELVCTKAELDWVRAGNVPERLTMIFSSKEAVYKAFYPFCHRYIDFKDVELSWAPEQAHFQGTFLAPPGPGFSQGLVFAAHCDFHAELVFSCVMHPSSNKANEAHARNVTRWLHLIDFESSRNTQGRSVCSTQPQSQRESRTQLAVQDN